MIIIYGIAFICFALIWFPWLYRRVFRPNKARKSQQHWLEQHPRANQIKAAQLIINQLYTDNRSRFISVQQRKILGLADNDTFVYGEIEFLAFAELLDGIPPGGVFYDLGCGGGRVVYSAALVHDFDKACGIELLSALAQFAEAKGEKFELLTKASPIIKHKVNTPLFINADIMNYDFRDASVIFVNATCFESEVWYHLTLKFSTLKPYTRIIVSSKSLAETDFELLSLTEAVMSWGMCSVRIYQKRPSTTTIDLNPVL